MEAERDEAESDQTRRETSDQGESDEMKERAMRWGSDQHVWHLTCAILITSMLSIFFMPCKVPCILGRFSERDTWE